MELEKLLRLNLQYFAEGEGENDKGTKGDEENKGEGANEEFEGSEKKTDGEPDKAEGGGEGKTFTQADVDRIVKERLEREKKKREEAIQKERDEAERKRLEEQGEYKELAEKLQAQLDAYKEDALKAKKEALLVKAGYSDKQVGVVYKLLEGETDEELEASLAEVVEAVTPESKAKKYADPSAGNGKKSVPDTRGADEVGKSLFQRLKTSGKIR